MTYARLSIAAKSASERERDEMRQSELRIFQIVIEICYDGVLKRTEKRILYSCKQMGSFLEMVADLFIHPFPHGCDARIGPTNAYMRT